MGRAWLRFTSSQSGFGFGNTVLSRAQCDHVGIMTDVKQVHLCVHYLSGNLGLALSKEATGADLFDLTCKCLDIRETWYFGLQYADSKGYPAWIKESRKLKEQVKPKAPLFFLVKYFPEDASDIGPGMARKLLYEQARQSILSMAIYCPPELSVLLASYELQAEHGNVEKTDYSVVEPRELLPRSVLNQYSLSKAAWKDSIRSWHKDHHNITTEDARLEYLRVVQILSMYGVCYFPVKWLRQDVFMGISIRGVAIYDPSELLLPKTTLKWLFIKVITYSAKKITIRSVFSNIPAYIFYTKRSKTTQQIFDLIVGNHNVYLRKRRVANIQVMPTYSTNYGRTMIPEKPEEDDTTGLLTTVQEEEPGHYSLID